VSVLDLTEKGVRVFIIASQLPKKKKRVSEGKKKRESIHIYHQRKGGTRERMIKRRGGESHRRTSLKKKKKRGRGKFGEGGKRGEASKGYSASSYGGGGLRNSGKGNRQSYLVVGERKDFFRRGRRDRPFFIERRIKQKKYIEGWGAIGGRREN